MYWLNNLNESAQEMKDNGKVQYSLFKFGNFAKFHSAWF